MDGVLFADGDGRIVLMNPAAEHFLGVKSLVAVGQIVDSVGGRDELANAIRDDQRKALSDHSEILRTVEVHQSGLDLAYIKIATQEVLDAKRDPAGVITTLVDITDEFKIDQLKNQYLSIVAHELRTPLTGIKTFATMMARGVTGDLTERQVLVVESIREQSLRLEHQIDKLINLGDLEGNVYGQDLATFALDEFLQVVVAPFEQAAKDRQIEIAYSFDGVAEVQVRADRTDLRRACQAFVENAVKITPDGGRVVVGVEFSDDRFSFFVQDSGIGIDPRYHRRIFEKFFQVEDPLTRHYGGAGLGLFVAEGIVEAHHSRIHVVSQLGTGARFSFSLPVAKDDGQNRDTQLTGVACEVAPDANTAETQGN